MYGAQGLLKSDRLSLPAFTDGIWHGFMPGLTIGQLYGLRAYGPYQPSRGQPLNPAKFLLDSFARAMVGNTQSPSMKRDYQGHLPTRPWV